GGVECYSSVKEAKVDSKLHPGGDFRLQACAGDLLAFGKFGNASVPQSLRKEYLLKLVRRRVVAHLRPAAAQLYQGHGIAVQSREHFCEHRAERNRRIEIGVASGGQRARPVVPACYIHE